MLDSPFSPVAVVQLPRVQYQRPADVGLLHRQLLLLLLWLLLKLLIRLLLLLQLLRLRHVSNKPSGAAKLLRSVF